MLELTEIKAIVRSPDKELGWVNVVFYDGDFIEWFYSKTFRLPERAGIKSSQIKIEGKNRIEGRLYFTNELNQKDKNIYYIDELAILDYSLFDLSDNEH